MASDFLKRKAQEQAQKIDEEYGASAYGGTEDSAKPTRASGFLARKAQEQATSGVNRGTPVVYNSPLMDLARETVQPADPLTEMAREEVRHAPYYGKGNIDLNNRPIYRHPDGSISTVYSMSVGMDGKEVLLPRIGRDQSGNPILWTEDQAIDNYMKTGEYLGMFDTVEEADAYAEWLHNQQAERYETAGASTVTNTTAPRLSKMTVNSYTPDAGLYLTKAGREMADAMQEKVDTAYSDYASETRAYKENNADLNAQRRETNKAYTRAALATPTAAASGAPASVWDEYKDRLAAAEAENEKLKALGGRRDGEVPVGAIEAVGAGTTNAAGTLLDFGARYGYFSGEDDWMNKTPELGAVTKLHNIADDLADRSAERITGAKAGRSALGQTLIDAEVSGIQMAGDALLNTFVPGAGLAAMGVRSFGSAAQDARRRGANVARQFGYGAAVSAVEVLSEKMYDGVAGIYGKGAADELVEKVVEKLATSEGGRRALKWLASAVGEMGEEWAAGIVDPMLESIIDGSGLFSHYSLDTAADILHDGLVGFILGGLGGAVEASPVGEYMAQQGKGTQYYELTQQAARAGAYYNEIAQRYGEDSEQAKAVMEQVVKPVQERLSALDTEIGELAKQISEASPAQLEAETEEAAAQTVSQEPQMLAQTDARQPFTPTQMVRMMASEDGIGENGAQIAETIASAHPDAQDVTNLYGGIRAVYNAGLNGETLDSVTIPAVQQLTPAERMEAFNAGKQDAIAAQVNQRAETAQQTAPYTYDVAQAGDRYTVRVTGADGRTQNIGEYATQKEAQDVADYFAQAYNNTAKEAGQNGIEGAESVRGRSAGDLAQRASQQTGAVPEGAAGAGGQRGAAAPARSARQRSGEKVSRRVVQAQSLISNAAPNQTVTVLDGPETESQRNIDKLAQQNGIKGVTLFEGGQLAYTAENGEIGHARAYHNPDGTIGVQTDNAEIADYDLALHEVAEHLIDTGKLNADDALEAAAKYVAPEKIDEAIRFYADCLAPRGETTSAEIIEHAKNELVCDGGDHINQLRYDVEHGVLTSTEMRNFADLLDEVLDGINRANNELTDNAFVLKAETTQKTEGGTRYSGKLETERNAYIIGGEYDEWTEVVPRRSETKQEFLARSAERHAKTYTVGETTYAYRRVGLYDSSYQAERASREAKRLGIKNFIFRDMEVNSDGYTEPRNSSGITIGRRIVGFNADMSGNGIETAGHEAFHYWAGNVGAEFSDYAVLLVDSIKYDSPLYNSIKQGVEIAYRKEGLSPQQLKGIFFEEVLAEISGRLHAAEPDDYMLRSMFTDYDAVKAAWDNLVDAEIAKKTNGNSRYSTKLTAQQDADYAAAVESGDMQAETPDVPIEEQINQSMTMEQARQMIQRAFVLAGIKEWYDGKYRNGDEWLRGEGAADVALIVDNEYTLQAAYLDKIPGVLNGDFYAEDIIDAYQKGTLTGKKKAPPTKADLSQGVAVNDPRFYAPKKIAEAKALLETANQRVTKSNQAAVYAARAQILLYAHNKGAAETLGLTEAELNKKLRTWSNYSASARTASQRVNAGVQESNRWTGIENSAYIMRASVTQDEVARMVGSIEGDSDGYQNKYIARTMLALDTHIDWTWLDFKFDTKQGVNAHKTSGSCNGYYMSSSHMIHVIRNSPNTVAHEMGHALDDQWGRDVGVGGFISQSSRNSARISDEVRPWFDRVHAFCDTLVDSSDISSAYAGDIKETFARFVDRFVGWTEKLATGYTMPDRSWYSDKFTAQQFIDFARLLQEKAALDANGYTRNQVPNAKASREIPNNTMEDTENQDIRYSRELPESLQELRRQNEALRERAEYWKGQTRRTTEITARAEDAKKAARDLVKSYDSTVDAAEIAPELKSLTEYVMRGGDDFTWSGLKERAQAIAREIVNNAEVLRSADDGAFDEVRALLKRPMKISPQDAHDVTPDGWGAWRNSVRDRVNVSINGDGTPVDTVYQQLSEMMPGMFPEDIMHPADQLQRMVEVMNDLAPAYENPFSYNMAEAIEYCANDIIDRVLGEDIRQTPPTFADKAAARLAAEKARGAQKVAEVREQKNAQIAALKERNAWETAQRLAQVRAQRDAKIEALKERYAEKQQAARDRRADSAARTKLLKIAKRLMNKKLPAVSRAWINEKIGDLDTVAKSITGKGVENLVALRDWYEEQKASNPDFIADAATEAKIARLAKTQISDLTPTQVQELTEVLLNFEHEINSQRQLLESEDKRDTRQMVLESMYNVEEAKGSKKTLADWLATNTLSPVRLVKRLVGYNADDPLLARTKELADGQRRMMDYQMRAERLFSKWTNDKKLMDRLRSRERVKITGLKNGQAVEVEITPDMRMALYLHSLNDENMKHIANGGVTIPNIDLYLNGELAEAYARGITVKLTPSNVRSIAAGMSAEERAYARAAHDYFNGMSRDEINAVSEALVGYSIAGVEDYFPIETDRNFTKSDIAELKRDGTIEGMGFLKERVHASNAINLVPLTDVLNRSIKNHAKYVGLAIPVRNMGKIWGMNAHNDVASEDSGLRQAIGHKWGNRGVEAVEQMITDLQNSYHRTDEAEKLLAKIRSNYAGAVLSLNASVALKQAASYPTAAAVLGWGPLAKALGNVGRVDLDLINKYTPLQWYRSQGYSTQELGDIRGQKGFMDKVLGASVRIGGRDVPILNWIQGIDLATTRKLWKASEYYVRQQSPDLSVGSDAYYRAVADIYNRVIEETQPNYTTMQRPQLLRSNNQLLQSLVMFKTQPFQNFGILYDALGELSAAERAAKNGDDSKLKQAKKNAANAVTSNLVSAAVFAAMTMAWALARRKKDKYEDKDGNFSPWAQLGKDMLSSEFGMIPFGSDAYNLLASWVFDEKYYGMTNITSDSISGALDSMKTAFDTLGSAVSAMLDGDDATSADPEKIARQLFNAAKDVSKLAGIPLENVVNLVTAVYTNVASAVNGEYVTAYNVLRLTKNMDSSASKSAAYDLLYKASRHNNRQFQEMKRMMIEDGFKEKNIDAAMKKRAEK